MVSPFGRFFKKREERINLTSINLKFMGETHGLPGREVPRGDFELELPFQNKIGSDLLPDSIKGPPIKINKITVSKPFSLVSISPELPQEIPYMERKMFRLKLNADLRYSGPILIDFGNDPSDAISLGISKISLVCGSNRTDLEETSSILKVQKSQVLMKEIQLYRVLGYNEHVSSISVNKPFTLLSSDPKPPFNVDKKDSFRIKIFVKAPAFDYSGPLEIVFAK
ncbi:hypothetical protein M1394_00445 [Candidatus Marsarchaeota archaeon]|nr:hypothetical protein [Candidatus Marsarchaeota archaeon]